MERDAPSRPHRTLPKNTTPLHPQSVHSMFVNVSPQPRSTRDRDCRPSTPTLYIYPTHPHILTSITTLPTAAAQQAPRSSRYSPQPGRAPRAASRDPPPVQYSAGSGPAPAPAAKIAHTAAARTAAAAPPRRTHPAGRTGTRAAAAAAAGGGTHAAPRQPACSAPSTCPAYQAAKAQNRAARRPRPKYLPCQFRFHLARNG